MFILFHIGLGAFLDIGPYPLMSIAPLFVLLPTRFWQVWWPRIRGRTWERQDTEPSAAQAGERAHLPGVPAARIGAPRLVQAFACLVIAYTLLYQIQDARSSELPRPLQVAAGALRLNQNYKMMREIGSRNFWLIVDGRSADGSHIDPFQRRPVSLEKPDDIPATLRSFRWRQFILGSIAHVATTGRARVLHHAFGEYLCREWNSDHSGAERLERLKTVRGYETTYLDHVGPAEYAVLWRHECGASLEEDSERDAASGSTTLRQSRREPSERQVALRAVWGP
jgi:hypothetical protein